MSVVRVNFVVEGQTEETFVNRILAPHLGAKGFDVRARCVTTSRDRRAGRVHRGGMPSFEKIRFDLAGWLKEDTRAYLTTMFDLYALSTAFPGYEESRRLPSCYDRAARLEEALQATIAHPRFLPYIQLHEFEALLFSDPAILDQEMVRANRTSRLHDLHQLLAGYASPEEIDDGAATAPSKRLDDLYDGYARAKTTLGIQVALRTGLSTMRTRCPHFDAWLGRLENLPPLV